MSQWYLQLSHTHLYRIVHTYMHNMGKNNSQTGILTVGMSVIIIATYTLPLGQQDDINKTIQGRWPWWERPYKMTTTLILSPFLSPKFDDFDDGNCAWKI